MPRLYYKGTISEIGDLSVFYGLNDIDCSGLTLVEGKLVNNNLFPSSFKNCSDYEKLFKDGVTSIVNENMESFDTETNVPFIFLLKKELKPKFGIDEIIASTDCPNEPLEIIFSSSMKCNSLKISSSPNLSIRVFPYSLDS